jgi:hypothetical protein
MACRQSLVVRPREAQPQGVLSCEAVRAKPDTRNDSVQRLLQVDKIAPVKSQSFEKRQDIRCIPAYRSVNVGDSFGSVYFQNLFGQPGSDALPHVLGIHPHGGDPGALFRSETEWQDIAEHESDYSAVQLSHDASVIFAVADMFLDQPMDFVIDGMLCDADIDVADIFGIPGLYPANAQSIFS